MSGDSWTGGGRTLLVASTGGHLSELVALRDRFVGLDDVEWVTFDSPQTRDLLAGEVVHLVPEVRPRDLKGAVANLPFARDLIRERKIDRVVSTGAGVAIPYLMTARRLGLPAHYIESAARTEQPSLTGSLAARIPGVSLYSQHLFRTRGWSVRGSVFDRYRTRLCNPVARVRKVVVAFGSQRDYDFGAAARALVPALTALSTPETEILWQTGDTDVSDLDIQATPLVPYADLVAAVREADLVIAHAGVGSALMALEAGRVPVLVPRRAHRGEHTDDHQVQIASSLASLGLAEHLEVDTIDAETLAVGIGRTVTSFEPPLPFHLIAEPARSARSLRRAARGPAVARPVVPMQRRADAPAPAIERRRATQHSQPLAPAALRMPRQRGVEAEQAVARLGAVVAAATDVPTTPDLRVLAGGLSQPQSDD